MEESAGWLREIGVVDAATMRGLAELGVFVVDAARDGGWAEARRCDLVHPEDRPAAAALGDTKLGCAAAAEYRVAAGGSWRWVSTRVVAVESRGRALVVGVDEDVTARRELEARLLAAAEEAERRFDLSESMRAADLVASAAPDLGATIAAVLGQARMSIPFSSARVYAETEVGLKPVGAFPEGEAREVEPGPGGIEGVAESRSPLVARAPGSTWIGVPLILRGALLGALEILIPEAEDRRGDYLWPAMTFADMIAIRLEGEARRRELLRAATTDDLTGLLARKSFEEVAGAKLSRLAAQGGEASLVLADIDHFKSFNDRYGHLKGDEVLRRVAGCMREGLRQEDAICRFGGEEIVAFLPSTGAERAREVSERLRAKIGSMAIEGIEERITASFGVAACRAASCQGLKDLVDRADRAMYRAKDLGRDRVVVDDAGPPRGLAGDGA